MPTPSQTDKTVESPSTPSIRSLVFLVGGAAGIGILLALSVSVIRVARVIQWRPILLGLDGMRLPLVILAVVLIALVALAVWLRPRLRTLAMVSLLLVIVATAGGLLLRIESFYGNLIPRLTWRWAPTAEEQYAIWQATANRSTANTSLVPALEVFPPITDRDHPGFLGAERTGVVRAAATRSGLEPPPSARVVAATGRFGLEWICGRGTVGDHPRAARTAGDGGLLRPADRC